MRDFWPEHSRLVVGVQAFVSVEPVAQDSRHGAHTRLVAGVQSTIWYQLLPEQAALHGVQTRSADLVQADV